jgi:tRNA nucleotidyltransferase (CCA-adding enzyme)
MERYAHRILHVARERWMIELDKLLEGDAVVYALDLLAATGLLRFMLPELHLQVGYDQNSPYHDRTLWEHTLGVVEATPADVTLRWGALLHDIAKPFVRVEKPGRSTYVKHDILGAEMVERLALYLKWSKKRREDVRELVRDHLLETSPLREADMSAKPLRDSDEAPAS